MGKMKIRNGLSRFIPDDIGVLWDEYTAANGPVTSDLASAIDGGDEMNQTRILDRILGLLADPGLLHELNDKERPQWRDEYLKLKGRLEHYLTEAARHAIISVDRAVNVIQRDYQDDVESIAQSVADWMEETPDSIPSGDEFMEYLDQSVDSSQRVTYTFQARLGLLATNSEDAYEEEFGEEPGTVEQQMYAALRRDVIDALERMGYDPNDPQPLSAADSDESEESSESSEEEDNE